MLLSSNGREWKTTAGKWSVLTSLTFILFFCNCATLITIEVFVGVEENCNLDYLFSLYKEYFNVGLHRNVPPTDYL